MKNLIIVAFANFIVPKGKLKSLSPEGQNEISSTVSALKNMIDTQSVLVMSATDFGSQVTASKITQALGLETFQQYAEFCKGKEPLKGMLDTKKIIQKMEKEAEVIIVVVDKDCAEKFGKYPELFFEEEYYIFESAKYLSMGEAIDINLVKKTIKVI